MGSTKVRKVRKATFKVTGVKNERIFIPVNKRAKTVARKAGKRSRVTVADLKALKGSGSYRYYVYTEVGTLKAVRV